MTKKNKNVSKTVPNGAFIITNDKFFYGTDGKSDKTRMATVIDSNKKDELAIVKYTTSKKHGRTFKNNKGLSRHSDTVYIKDDSGKPIKIDNKKFQANSKRDITQKQANEIKRRNVKESKYQKANRKRLRQLKGRKKG